MRLGWWGQTLRIEYWANRHASEVIACMGRTEDVKFSPSGQRLGIAEFQNNRIALFDLNHEQSAQKRIGLTHTIYVSSPKIDKPHGMDFIDEETIIVANRNGDVCVFRVAPIGSNSNGAELVQVIAAGDATLINTPGSVAVVRGSTGLFEALVCNNYMHHVTRHMIDSTQEYEVTRSEILLREWLRVPDGISVSNDARWIAVSNHDMHNVFVYENTATLNEDSYPDGILRSISYPHGLRFTADGRFIFLADAGAPYVHLYGRSGGRWQGVYNPLLSFRVMDEETYLSGRYTTSDGGPKGLDVDSKRGLLVTTCHRQPLAFFDLESILAIASDAAVTHETRVLSIDDQAAGYFGRRSEIRHELELHQRLYQAETRAERAEQIASGAEARIEALQQSNSWRLTAPLRALASVMRKRRGGKRSWW